MHKHIISITLLGLMLQGCSTAVVTPKAQDNTLNQPPEPSHPQPGQPQASEAQSTLEASPDKRLEQAQVAPPKQLSNDLLYHLLAAEIAIQRSQFQVSLKHYMEASRLSRDPRVVERTTRIAVYARDDKNAFQAAQLWLELEPERIEAHQVMAALLVRQGQADKALKHFEAVISQGNMGGELKGYMLITSMLSKERDKQTALKVMEKLVAKRQHNSEALYAYSHLALLVGSLSVAEANIEKVLSLRPDWTEARILQANILIRQGQHIRAIKQLREALAMYPNDIVVRLYLARKLVDEKKFEQAQKQFARVLQDKPDSADALYALGLLGLQLNQLNQAEQRFNQLILLGDRVSESRYYLGQIAEQREDVQAAIQRYEVITTGKYYVEAQIRIASIIAQQGYLNEARERLQNVTAATMDVELRLYLAEGELLRDAREYQEAFELYSVALKQMPGNTQLLYARALTAEKLDNIDISIRDLSQIVKNEPNNAQALNALGYTLVDQTDRLKEGVAYIEKAIKLKPDDAAIIDSMGWAYYRQGKYKEAVVYLRRALETLKDAEIAAHLGEVLWMLGDQEEARKVWEDALRDTPEHKVLLNVIHRFIK